MSVGMGSYVMHDGTRPLRGRFPERPSLTPTGGVPAAVDGVAQSLAKSAAASSAVSGLSEKMPSMPVSK